MLLTTGSPGRPSSLGLIPGSAIGSAHAATRDTHMLRTPDRVGRAPAPVGEVPHQQVCGSGCNMRGWFTGTHAVRGASRRASRRSRASWRRSARSSRSASASTSCWSATPGCPRRYHRPMRREHALPAGVAALMLFGALAQHEYSYYTVLRWVVTVAALIVAWAGTRAQQPFVPLPFLMIAFLFNPLLPIVMDRQAWVVIDLICGALFAAVCVAELPPHDPPKAQRHGTPSPAVRPIALIEGTRPAREHQTHDPDLCGAGPPPPPVGATSLAFQAITPPLSPQTVAVRVDGGQIT